jgi:hypothetical protein
MADRETHRSYDLDSLENQRPGPTPPPVDVRSLIANMPYQEPLAPMTPVGR